MKKIMTLVTFLVPGSVFANDYCQAQKLLGFEGAVFIMGASIPNHNPQAVIDELFVSSEATLVQVDTFATPKTYFELLRVKATNELVLMTVSMDDVCFYMIPTAETQHLRY